MDQTPFPRPDRDPDQDPGPPDPAPPSTGTSAVLVGIVVVVALAGVWISAAAGTLDSALLFVGIPCLLGLGVALLPSRGGAGSVFQAVTVVLLLSSALLHEGAICVLLASPLIYGAAFAVYGLTRLGSRRYALAPVLVVVALEGVVPGLRVHAEQHAGAEQVVAADCTDFEAALVRGPVLRPGDRGRLLDTAGYATPVSASGTGLAVGDTWTFAMPSGQIDTAVTEAADGHLAFEVVSDTSKTTRFVGLHGGSLDWADTPEGCRAALVVDYQRRLDPSLWFGPVSTVFMDAGARAFLRGLD